MLKDAKASSSFSVDDLQKARQFYSGILSLEVAEIEMGLLELRINGGNDIMVYPKPNHVPATFTVLNFSVGDVEKTVDSLIEKGVQFEQYTGDIQTDEKGICRNAEGPMIAWFKDPAGNILSILQKK